MARAEVVVVNGICLILYCIINNDIELQYTIPFVDMAKRLRLG